MMLGISYRGKKPEKEGLKKQLNNVKPGLLNGEIETEKGGQRRGVKKQLNSVKPGLLNGEKELEQGGHKQGVKKQLNSVKPGLLNGQKETEQGGHKRGVKKQLKSVKPGLPDEENRKDQEELERVSNLATHVWMPTDQLNIVQGPRPLLRLYTLISNKMLPPIGNGEPLTWMYHFLTSPQFTPRC